MVKPKYTRIEPLLLSVQKTTQLIKDLKAKEADSFEQWIIAPSRESMLSQLKATYPELENQSDDILQDGYRKLEKQISRIESVQQPLKVDQLLWGMIKAECKLAFPTPENLKKNLGLSRLEFKTLCAQLKNGKEELIEKVYLSHFKKCKSYLVYNDKANDEEAHSASMEALIEIRKDLLRDKIFYGNLGYYFTNRAKNKLYKLRIKKKEINLPIDGIEIEEEEKTESELIHSELTSLITDAINRLCGECKNIVKEFYYEGKTLKEIGEKMNKSHGAIRKQTTRCRDKLRKLLGENFYDQFSTYFS